MDVLASIDPRGVAVLTIDNAAKLNALDSRLLARLACCVEVLDRAHGRPRPALADASAGPLLVDFQWSGDAPQRLLEATAIGDSDGEAS